MSSRQEHWTGWELHEPVENFIGQVKNFTGQVRRIRGQAGHFTRQVGNFMGQVGNLMGQVWNFMGWLWTSWDRWRTTLGGLETSWEWLGESWGKLDTSWYRLGTSWNRLDTCDRLGTCWDRSGTLLVNFFISWLQSSTCNFFNLDCNLMRQFGNLTEQFVIFTFRDFCVTTFFQDYCLHQRFFKIMLGTGWHRLETWWKKLGTFWDNFFISE